MKLYRTARAVLLQTESEWFAVEDLAWDELFRLDDPLASLHETLERHGGKTLRPAGPPAEDSICVPVDHQEVWAAGVTYHRSREARMAESEKAGGSSVYDRVYEAERPELFYKGSSRTVVGPHAEVRIRWDSSWNVPEPELTLAVSSRGRIIGFTIGNDMSSRDIEGANPLYLPQAKVYDGSAALGPGVLLGDGLPPETEIRLHIERGGIQVFSGCTAISQMRRSLACLVEYLFRDNSFPHGCFLMTGTGIVPPAEFTLSAGDVIHVTIPPIGTLTNTVAQRRIV
jgi:2-dehydro-3-deoxy-D-arabinonate dehydratase